MDQPGKGSTRNESAISQHQPGYFFECLDPPVFRDGDSLIVVFAIYSQLADLLT
jgi:hypothetical protein